MRSSPTQLLALAFGLAAAVPPRVVHAQQSVPATEGDGSGLALTPDAEAALAAALAADVAPPVAEPAEVGGGGGGGVKVDTAWILDVAASGFSDKQPEQAGGHDPSRNGFTLQQLELSLGTNVDPFLRLDSNIVFSLFGVEIEEAYATTLALPGNLQLRAGQFLSRFGRINHTHPHAWNFVDQPIAIGKMFGGEGNRGLGAEVSWLAPTPWYMEWLGSAQQLAGECCTRSYAAETYGTDGPADLVYTVRAEQFFPFSDNLALAWGLNLQTGPLDTGFGNRGEIYGTDLYLRYRPVDSAERRAISLTIEAMLRRRQIPGDVLQDAAGYAQLVANWSPRWETGVRYELGSGVEQDPVDPAWTETRDRTSLQQTYYPSHFSRLRAQVSVDRPDWKPQPVWAGMLALELLAGDHGAHAY